MPRLSGATPSPSDTSPTRARLAEPLAGFGEMLTAQLEPRIRIDAIYGILESDVQTLTATGGSASAADNLFTVTTGTNVGGYGVLRSRRLVRYRPGNGSRYRFTALFTTGVANSQQWAGAFSAVDMIAVGYLGADFGILLRQPGKVAIHRLTVTTGAGGVETITVTLDGVAFSFATPGALSTTALAELIAEQTSDPYVGWNGFAPQSVGATVTFMQNDPATTTGAFTLASTGTAAGTFATIQVGEPNVATEASGAFVPQAAWNVDTMDGSGNLGNPTRATLDPTKMNVYEIVHTHLGGGPMHVRVMLPNGEWQTVHTFHHPGAGTGPTMTNPTLRLGWIAASLGSTTDLAVSGASAAAYIEGSLEILRDPFGADAPIGNVTTTETVAVAFRARGEFGGTVSQREFLPLVASIGSETANRLVIARVYLNPTIVGTVNWARVSTESAADYALPSGATVSGGRAVASLIVSGGNSEKIDAEQMSIRGEPGDVIAITLQTVTSTAPAIVSVSWHEI